MSSMQAPPRQVVVVGAGILGSSIAWHLAHHPRRCQINVFEAGPAAAGLVTGRSWAWLNAQKKRPAHYRDLNLNSLREWKSRFPHLVQPCGAVVIGDPDPSQDPEYPCRALSAAEVQALEPSIFAEAAAGGGHLYEQEAWADPVAAANHFLTEAKEAGAAVHFDSPVTELLLEPAVDNGDDRAARADSQKEGPKRHQPLRVTGVRTAAGGIYKADVVVLAAGTATAGLARQANYELPLLDKPAMVALTEPITQRLLSRMLATPDVFILQRPDGVCMLGDPAGAATTAPPDAGAMFHRHATAVLPALSSVAVANTAMVALPWPADGHPVIGCSSACHGLYLCVTHSGMTLAPLLGRLVADEVAGADAEISKTNSSSVPESAVQDGGSQGSSSGCTGINVAVCGSGGGVAGATSGVKASAAGSAHDGSARSSFTHPQLQHYRPDREFLDRGAYGWVKKEQLNAV